jgi:type I restriction enzyme M protein
MIISAYKLQSVNDFIDWIELIKEEYSFFRGESNSDWNLRPSIGRFLDDNKLDDKIEKQIFSAFKKRCYHKVQKVPKNDFEWMMICQHHGLPTRLLDWTLNPLIALYFSVCEMPNNDGAIYALKKMKTISPDSKLIPFKISNVEKVIPYYISDRQIAQSGCFTIHASPREIYNNNSVYKIKISASDKIKILQILKVFGITKGVVFPDLSSMAEDIIEPHRKAKIV